MTNDRHVGGIPEYRIEVGRGMTLAWDVFTYGPPNEANVRRFLERFREKGPDLLVRGPKRIVDQSTGDTIVEIDDTETP